MNLNHAHFGTKDMAAFQEFYGDFFGFKKLFDHGTNGAFLRNEAGFLLAVDVVGETPTMPEWYHLGFCLDDEAKVWAMYDKMKSRRVNIVRDMMAEKGEFASFFIKDPDGNKLEISWHAGE